MKLNTIEKQISDHKKDQLSSITYMLGMHAERKEIHILKWIKQNRIPHVVKEDPMVILCGNLFNVANYSAYKVRAFYFNGA